MARYMMATKAIHKLGDISRDEPDLCVIHSEDGENYIGNWVTGLGFIDVKFPKSTTRELTEEEKEKYHGMQIEIGGSPVFAIYTKEAKPVETKESPVMVLPTDETRKEQLQDKMKECRGRLHPYRAPELQMGTICKIAVLERLLKDGQVNTWDLSREMANIYGSGFDVNEFNNACAVIEDYCKTGGKNLRGETGPNSEKTEIPTKAIIVTTRNSVYRFGKANQKGERTVSRYGNSLDFARCIIVSLTVGDDMALKCLDGPHPGWYTTRVLSIK